MDPYEFENRFRLQISPSDIKIIAGTDEVGRGPLAGPVVAAAVILPQTPQIDGLADSKALSPEQREAAFCEIQETAHSFAIAIVEPNQIDAINILQASLKAMRQAISNLEIRPDLVLVDGNQKTQCGIQEMCIVKGDQLSASIMAASILAKVTRDHIMIEAHQQFPQYGFDGHKGYGSAQHIKAIEDFGPCPLHRMSFAPMKAMTLNQEEEVWATMNSEKKAKTLREVI